MTHDHHDCPASDQLEVARKAMKAIDVSEVPEELIRRVSPAMRQASRRRDWRTQALRGTTAATIMLALLGAVIMMMRTSPVRAFAAVARRVEATRTVRAVVVDPREGGTLLSSGTRMRFERDGAVVIADSATRQEVMLETKSKSAYRIPHARSEPGVGFLRRISRLGRRRVDADRRVRRQGGPTLSRASGQVRVEDR